MFILQVPTVGGPGSTTVHDDFNDISNIGQDAIKTNPPPGTTRTPTRGDRFERETSFQDLARQAMITDPTITYDENGNQVSSTSGGRSFISYPTLHNGVLLPASIAANNAVRLRAAAMGWRYLREGRSLVPLARYGVQATRLTSYIAQFPRLAKAAEWVTRGVGYLGRLGNIRGVGYVLKLGGGRVIPAIGAGLAAIDVGMDWYNFATIQRQEGESEEEFQARRAQARDNAIINTGCTAAGAVIGGIIGSIIPGAGTVLGALIGAGIGNIVGNLCKGFSLKGIGRSIWGFLTGR